MANTFLVTDVNGQMHRIECDFAFNDAGHLMFRSGVRGSTEVVAMFGAGRWVSCLRVYAPEAATAKEAN
jgi:hypothetical protein